MSQNTCESYISIVIPAHRQDLILKECLESLLVNSHFEKCELIVVLDGIRKSEKFFSQFTTSDIRILELDTSRGPAYARNYGALHAKANILFFLDSDVQIKPDTISRVLDHFSSDDASEAVIGSYDDQPKHQSLVSKYRNLLHHYTHQNASEEAFTFWGACGAIKRDVFKSIGGFDETFDKPSVEDIEFGYRLTLSGNRVMMDKKLQVKHLKKWSFIQMVNTDIFYRSKPWTKLLYQYGKWGVKDLNVSISDRLASIFLTLLILSLLGSLLVSGLLYLTPLLCLLLLLVKRKTYLFFSDYFTIWFPAVILLHWLYLVSALLGLMLGTFSYFISRASGAQKTTHTTFELKRVEIRD